MADVMRDTWTSHNIEYGSGEVRWERGSCNLTAREQWKRGGTKWDEPDSAIGGHSDIKIRQITARI